MTRLFRYILAHDAGLAPCIEGGWLSLATCKPKVRAGARRGDWVVGFAPRPAERGLLVWAGRVATSEDFGTYEHRHRGRADAVYRQMPDGGFQRLRPEYHPGPDDMRKDLSAPVLTFDRDATWYFGASPRRLPEALMHLSAGGRGHRTSGDLPDDPAALFEWLTSLGPPGVHGKPRGAGQLTPPDDDSRWLDYTPPVARTRSRDGRTGVVSRRGCS